MKTILIAICLLYLLNFTSAGYGRQEVEENDITSESKEKSRNYPESIFDDILGEDYFNNDDEIKEADKAEAQRTIDEPEVVSEKAICAGCPSDVNPEDEKIREMALFAFKTYAARLDSGDSAQSLVQVKKAQTQVVAGYKYILQIEAGWTNCSKAELEMNPGNCEIDESRGSFLCDFEVVEQSWISKKEVVASKCHHTDLSEEEQQMVTEKFIPRIEGEGKDSDIEDETTTVENTEFVEKKRRKRETIRESNKNIGALKDAEEGQEYIMDLAKFAVEQLDNIDEDNNARLVVEVLSAKKQTVSGWLYHLKTRVASTTCSEGKPNTLEACKDKIILPFNICHIKILFQPWQTVQKKITESQCYPEKIKKSKKIAKKLFKDGQYLAKPERRDKVVGGSVTVDPESKDIVELVSFAVESMDASSNALHAQKLVRVIEAQRQVVNGVKTKLVLEVGYTNCRKKADLDKDKCDIDEERDHQVCRIAIWERPWLNEKRVTESKCGNRDDYNNDVKKRDKRENEKTFIKDLKDLEKSEFKKFLSKYEKSYETEEEHNLRFEIFKENMKKMKLLQESEQGTAQYGATIFADLSAEEFAKHHLGLRPDLRHIKKRRIAKIPKVNRLPTEFDWRKFNAVTPVKNQGFCGSCWAFSVTGNIEGLYAYKHKKLLSFSEQELVDCDTLDQGCNGGLPENAYKSLQKIGGLETEAEYPYDGHGEKCQFNATLDSAKVTGFVEMPKNETKMAAWLVKNGPISIGINANAMQFYFGGVSHPWKFLCNPNSLDHGVLIVGFGVHTSSIRHKVLPYWIVKNSWGPHWGEQGYYRVYRGDNTCGLTGMATSAIIA